MRQPITLSHLFPTFCSFERQNLFCKKSCPLDHFVIPTLDQETYGEFLHFGPGLGVFTLVRFSCTDEDFWEASPFQDFVIPALDQETYGEFLQCGPGLEVFTLERFSCSEEDSRVYISLNINYDGSVGPRRTTKVSQEVWASSLGMKQEVPTYSSTEKQMEPTTSNNLFKQNCPETKASDKTKKKSKGCVPTTEVSANIEKTPKGSIPTAESSLKIKIPIKQEPIEDLTEKLEDGAQSADGARPRDEQEPVGNITQK